MNCEARLTTWRYLAAGIVWMAVLAVSVIRADEKQRVAIPRNEKNGAQSAKQPGANQEGWPHWRGPHHNGTWYGPNVKNDWPSSGLKQVWKTNVGGGYAGIVGVADRVYTLDRQMEPTERERVLCLDAATGELLWSSEWPVEYGDLQYGNGPRAAPTLHGRWIYTLGALGEVRCLDAATGKLQWETHLVDVLQGRVPTWGYAASPVIAGDLVIVLPGGEDDHSIVALDRRTGQKLWGRLGDEAGYAMPILIRHADREQLICWTPSHIRSLEPTTGTLLWSIPYEVTYGVAIAMPIFQNGTVVVAGYWEGSKAIRLGTTPQMAELAWEENRYLRGLMSQPLYRDGHAYLLDKQYGLTCFDWQTGKKLWDDKNRLTPRGRNPQASLVWLGDSDRILALNAEGELVLARVTPAGYEELARTSIIGETWAHPAFLGNRVYARSDTELVCVELPIAE